ncbi:hypothetical protein KBB76_01050 [Candidatus Saccharibacteria bacterium]|nr:hypothetical protein [Candidatus Saccharibacteria bacterium]
MKNKKSIKIVDRKWFKILEFWAISFVVLTIITITDFFYLLNYLEVFPKELLLPLIINICSSFLVALAVYLIAKPRIFVAKALTVIFMSFSLSNYDGKLTQALSFYRSFLPVLPPPNEDIPIISLLFLATLLSISILVGIIAERLISKSRNSLAARRLGEFMLVFIGVMAFWQIFRFMSTMPSIVRQSKTVAPEITSPQPLKRDTKPDIYYIVLDRYASQAVLKEQFNFDNQQFVDKLEKQNFYIKEDAYSNYPLTAISISSTLTANYTNKIVEKYKNNPVQSRVLYHNLIRQSAVVKALKKHGYKFMQIGSDYGASNKAPLADEDIGYSQLISGPGITKQLRGFEAIQFNKSIFNQFFKMNNSWWPFKSTSLEKVAFVDMQLTALNKIADDNGENGGRFIFAHILVPHRPFVFNKNGSISPYSGVDNYGKPIKTKYLDQIRYINGQMETIIDKVLQNTNGQAIIIINSDEGPYPQDLNSTSAVAAAKPNFLNVSDMSDWPVDWLKMKFSILQAVHMPQADKKDLQYLSSVNLFRIVLNSYFDYGLEYLPDCNFGMYRGDKFEYNYKNISEKVNGNTNPVCNRFQSIK